MAADYFQIIPADGKAGTSKLYGTDSRNDLTALTAKTIDKQSGQAEQSGITGHQHTDLFHIQAST